MKKSKCRIAIGTLIIIMWPVSFLGSLAFPGKQYDWWYTLSDTYYFCAAFPMFMGACGILFLLYDCYSRLDSIVIKTTGITCFLLQLFPCANTLGLEYVGFFQLPAFLSSRIHNVLSFLLISGGVINNFFLFTRRKNDKANKLYIICGVIMCIGMLCFMLCQVDLLPPVIKCPSEAILLNATGISWLTKGHLFEKYGL